MLLWEFDNQRNTLLIKSPGKIHNIAQDLKKTINYSGKYEHLFLMQA